MGKLRSGALVLALAIGLALPASGQATSFRAVKQGLQSLVAASGGPPGALATLYRDGRLTVLSAGRRNVTEPGASRSTDHMRIASVAKAFSAAVALHLVEQHRLHLGDTVGKWLPGLPVDWHPVTLRELLNHTSGIPDYTQSQGFVDQLTDDPQGFVTPGTIIDWVRDTDMNFTPGTQYEYSNTDNIVVGLMAQKATGKSYGTLLSKIVFKPATLTQTSFPSSIALPTPFIHGYLISPGSPPDDVSTFLSPSGAWASGAIVSTPANLNMFIRGDLGLAFFGPAQQAEQLQFVPGESSPPGPGTNSAGLGIFRYQTRCGTVYGHTGSFPGYTQWVAATRNGKRAVTTTINVSQPDAAVLAQLRAVQTTAVCALLRR